MMYIVVTHKTHRIASMKEETDEIPFWLKDHLKKEINDEGGCITVGNHMSCQLKTETPDNPATWSKPASEECPCKATKAAMGPYNSISEQLIKLAKETAASEGVSISEVFDQVCKKYPARYAKYSEHVMSGN